MRASVRSRAFPRPAGGRLPSRSSAVPAAAARVVPAAVRVGTCSSSARCAAVVSAGLTASSGSTEPARRHAVGSVCASVGFAAGSVRPPGAPSVGRCECAHCRGPRRRPVADPHWTMPNSETLVSAPAQPAAVHFGRRFVGPFPVGMFASARSIGGFPAEHAHWRSPPAGADVPSSDAEIRSASARVVRDAAGTTGSPGRDCDPGAVPKSRHASRPQGDIGWGVGAARSASPVDRVVGPRGARRTGAAHWRPSLSGCSWRSFDRRLRCLDVKRRFHSASPQPRHPAAETGSGGGSSCPAGFDDHPLVQRSTTARPAAVRATGGLRDARASDSDPGRDVPPRVDWRCERGDGRDPRDAEARWDAKRPPSPR